MSFISEVTRLKDAKNDIRTSIISKGVDVDSSATISSYSEFIDMIPPYIPVPANLSECEYDNIGRLISFTTNSNVTSINTGFRSCAKLASISMPNVTNIPSNTFQGCESLASVSIPNAVQIQDQAFQDCKKLATVTMQKVERIHVQAFYGCSSLTSVDLPDTLIAIYQNAFAVCKKLAVVTCRRITPPILNDNGIRDVSPNLVIYVPAESVDAYKTAENWSNFADRIQPIP